MLLTLADAETCREVNHATREGSVRDEALASRDHSTRDCRRMPNDLGALTVSLKLGRVRQRPPEHTGRTNCERHPKKRDAKRVWHLYRHIHPVCVEVLRALARMPHLPTSTTDEVTPHCC